MLGHPAATGSRSISTEDLLANLRRLQEQFGPPPPKRWMVRAADLSEEESAKLDLLCLPERPTASRYLPPDTIAAVFEEYRDTSEVLGRRIEMRLIYRHVR